MLWSVLTTKNGWKLLPFFICLLGFAVSFAFGIIGLVEGVSGNADVPQMMTEISRDEITSGEIYRVDDLYILDAYCVEASDSNPTYYCLATFLNKDYQYTVITLIVESSSDIYQEVVDYVSDSNSEWGDLDVPCYIRTYTFPSEDAVYNYYKSSREYLINEGFFYEDEFKYLSARYDYDYSMTSEEIIEDQISSDLSIAKIFMPLAAIMFVALVFAYKRLLKDPTMNGSENKEDSNNADYRQYLSQYQENNNQP